MTKYIIKQENYIYYNSELNSHCTDSFDDTPRNRDDVMQTFNEYVNIIEKHYKVLVRDNGKITYLFGSKVKSSGWIQKVSLYISEC